MWGRMFLLYMAILECCLVCGLTRQVWILDRAECDNRGSQCYQVGEERRHISCHVYWKRICISGMHQEACLLSKSGRKERRALKQKTHEKSGSGKKIVSRICFNSLVLHPGKFLPFSHPIPCHPFHFLSIPFPSIPFNPLKSLLTHTKQALLTPLLVLWFHHSHTGLRRIAFTATMFLGGTLTDTALATSNQHTV